MKRSNKTTDKKLALKLAVKFEEESRAKRTAKQARRVLSDIYKELSGEEHTSLTARQFFQEFVTRKTPEVSAATLGYYKGHAKRFMEWLGVKADSDLSEITKTQITAYRNSVSTHA